MQTNEKMKNDEEKEKNSKKKLRNLKGNRKRRWMIFITIVIFVITYTISILCFSGFGFNFLNEPVKGLKVYELIIILIAFRFIRFR